METALQNLKESIGSDWSELLLFNAFWSILIGGFGLILYLCARKRRRAKSHVLVALVIGFFAGRFIGFAYHSWGMVEQGIPIQIALEWEWPCYLTDQRWSSVAFFSVLGMLGAWLSLMFLGPLPS